MAEASANPAAVGEVALVNIKGNFLFDPATHRDFLGAALGTGVHRTQVAWQLATRCDCLTSLHPYPLTHCF